MSVQSWRCGRSFVSIIGTQSIVRNVAVRTTQLWLCSVFVLILGSDSLMAQAPPAATAEQPSGVAQPAADVSAQGAAPTTQQPLSQAAASEPTTSANQAAMPAQDAAPSTQLASPTAAAEATSAAEPPATQSETAPTSALAPAAVAVPVVVVEPSPDVTVMPVASEASVDEESSAAPTPYVVPPLTFKLTDDGKSYLRMLVWTQVWLRAMELNPGTQLKDSNADVIGDVALRRTRFLVFGKLTPEVLIQVHFGVNNQTFQGERKPHLFVHSAWGQIDVLGNYLTLGAGLHYWNGISRLSNASTIRFLGLDGPILNWPTVEASDQFGHQLGVFAKGQLGSLDYRFAVNRPFTSDAALTPGVTGFDVGSTHLALAGYVQWMFGETESNLLPYETGTYLGAKQVFNVGVGGHYQANAMARCEAGDDGMCGSEKESYDLVLFGADVFADTPVGDGAITAYGAYYYYDFGPDFVRHIGIMSLGASGQGSGGTLSGAGNRYPVVGTGHHVYAQAGYLLPVYLGTTRLQPYASLQLSMMEALADPVIVPEVGANWLITGHSVKVTLHYRNRPLFTPAQGDSKPAADGRASELIAQLQFAI